MQQHLLPIARNALIFSLSHVFQTSYVVLISIDHVQQILSCAWFPAHWSSSGPDKKLQDKLANSSKEIKRMDQIFSWSQCSKLQFKFPYYQKKTLLLDLYHDPVKEVLRLFTNQDNHHHVIFTRRECMRQIFRGQGWGGQGESSRPPPTIWVQMMKMTMISIMVDGEVDEMQLSSLRMVTIQIVPKKLP